MVRISGTQTRYNWKNTCMCLCACVCRKNRWLARSGRAECLIRCSFWKASDYIWVAEFLLSPGLLNYSPHSCRVSQVLLECSHVRLVRCCLGLLSHTRAGLSSCSRDCITHEVQNVYSLAPYKRSLLSPVLNREGGSFLHLAAREAQKCCLSWAATFPSTEERGEWIFMGG